jgi:hypothetical protein
MVLLCGSLPLIYFVLFYGVVLLLALIPCWLFYALIKRSRLWSAGRGRAGRAIRLSVVLLLYALTAGMLLKGITF